ncbi:hypothetical protein [uncultured Eubacterium sp.]|jgi:hypothetical protein|uniref:hypothetical protein n=1 Tax=uncultured Eubacterium sp. TaxID=165185 RepID=UPI0015ADA861|nr:hypothetical protein [uncultured Eubacterium sp.]
MNVEVRKLEIRRDIKKRTFEVMLDGNPINGVKAYELKSLENGEPELKLTLNISDFDVELT